MIISCAWCGKEFNAKPSAIAKGKKFCCKACHNQSMNKKVVVTCEWCDKESLRPPSQVKEHNFCDQDCKMKWLVANFNIPGHNDGRVFYQGKPRKPRNEYIYVGKKKKLHQAVAEKMLGRSLRKGEVVHHVNGNSLDNRPENLMVFPNTAAHSKWHADHDPNWGWKRGNRKVGDVK